MGAILSREQVAGYLMPFHGYHAAFGQFGRVPRDDWLEQLGYCLPVKSLQPDTNHRWGCCITQDQDSVEISVKCYDCMVSKARPLEYFRVPGSGHAEFTNVYTGDAVARRMFAASGGRPWSRRSCRDFPGIKPPRTRRHYLRDSQRRRRAPGGRLPVPVRGNCETGLPDPDKLSRLRRLGARLSACRGCRAGRSVDLDSK